MQTAETSRISKVVSQEAVSPREVIELPSITPREFGWQPSTVKTGLLDAPVQRFMISGDGKNDDTHCIVFPGLGGRRMVQVLQAGTAKPEGHFSVMAVEADWNLFKRALNRIGGDKGLLKQHTGDPKIGELMQQFGEGYVERWRRAINYGREGAEEAVLKIAYESMFVDMRYFPGQFLRNACDDPEFDRAEFVLSSRYLIFSNFLEEHKDLGELLDTFGSVHPWRRGADKRFESLSADDQKKWFKKYSEWLSCNPELQIKAVRNYLENYKFRAIIDINIQDRTTNIHYRSRSQATGLITDFTDNNFTLQNSEAAVVMGLKPTDNPAMPYTIDSAEITVHSEKPKDLVYPTIAWRSRKDPVTYESVREFLSLGEIQAKFGQSVPEGDLDDWLGIVAIAVFQPSVRSKTPERMHLRHEARKVKEEGGQKVEAVQIPVYYQIPLVKRQILQDVDGVLGSVEEANYSTQ